MATQFKIVLRIIAVVTFISVCSVGQQRLPCGAYEEWRNCSSCEGNCTDPDPVCTKECKPPKCQCIDGYVRYRGRCLNETQCPAGSNDTRCGVNEQYYECGGCEPHCDWWRNRICTLQCRIGCQCKPRYVRHPNGTCVRFWECPPRWGFGGRGGRLPTGPMTPPMPDDGQVGAGENAVDDGE
ncbi:Trypsin Inhibitor-like [Aphelenchoides avenae]|nr:Trypsin Inhibitor-like [Aphelenchus avenae]